MHSLGIKHITRFCAGLVYPLFALTLAFLWLCCLPGAAYAYVDPSVMTYTIQALAGVAVALSAVLGVAARKTRAWLLRLLDIDENSHVNWEERVYRLDEKGNPLKPCAQEDAPQEEVSAFAESTIKKPNKVKAFFRKIREKIPVDKRAFTPRWKERFPFALLASALTIGTILIMSPLEIVGASSDSLVFGLPDVWAVVLVPGLALIVALALIISIFRGRVFTLALALVGSVGLCAYLQSLCLNIGVPIANGDTLVWGDHAFMMTVCTIVWTAIIVLCALLGQVNLRRTQGLVAIASACLLVVQAVGVGSLVVSPPQSSGPADGDGLTAHALSQTEAIATEEGLYTVSSKDNVIVFVLDTFDTSTMKSLLRSNPAVLDEYTGFTCFTNVTGSMIPTHYAVPALLTGELPQKGEDFATYVSQRYARGSFLSDLSNAGYSIGLYSDSLGLGEIGNAAQQYQQVAGKTMNIHAISSSAMDLKGTLTALWQMALYREMPWSLKYYFWYYTDQINKAMVKYDADAPAEDTVYIIDDVRYFNQLNHVGLTVDKNDADTAGAFRFIHLLGPHYPYSYNEKGEYIGTDKSTIMKQAQGSLYMVQTYLQQLKDMELYDEATIIVTADHGTWWLTNEPLKQASCPILMVKPRQSAEDAQAPAAVTTAPVSHADILPTIRQSIGLEGRGTHEGVSSVYDFEPIDSLERVRWYYTTNTETRKELAIIEYAILGDAGSIANWQLTGVSWDPTPAEG